MQATRAAFRALRRPGIDLHLFGLDPARTQRHSDFCDLSVDARAAAVPFRSIVDVNAPETLALLREIAPDLLCVFGWSQLVGPEVRAIPKRGVLGWHPSPLPENRGRAVIPWSILQRRTSTALTIFWIDAGMDSGDIAMQVPIPMAADETATTLYAKVEAAGERGIALLFDQGDPASWPRHPQDHAKATVCARRTPEDGRIDWTRPAEEIWTLVRATTHPYPGAFTTHAGRPVILWRAVPVASVAGRGAPGEVLEATDGKLLVQCGDGGALRISEMTGDPVGTIRPHDCLGS